MLFVPHHGLLLRLSAAQQELGQTRRTFRWIILYEFVKYSRGKQIFQESHPLSQDLLISYEYSGSSSAPQSNQPSLAVSRPPPAQPRPPRWAPFSLFVFCLFGIVYEKFLPTKATCTTLPSSGILRRLRLTKASEAKS